MTAFGLPTVLGRVFGMMFAAYPSHEWTGVMPRHCPRLPFLIYTYRFAQHGGR
jgi:hypothetical protein